MIVLSQCVLFQLDLCPGMPEVAEGKGCNWLTKGHTP
jgi:hypothetical protein